MNKQAQPGNIFVLTEKGYNYRKLYGVTDCEIGHPMPEHEETVPESWAEHGLVEEKEAEDE